MLFNFAKCLKHTRFLPILIFMIVSIGSSKLCLSQIKDISHLGFIGHLDHDGIQDTLICKHLGKKLMPKYIIWGKTKVPINDAEKSSKFITTIVYPEWKNIRGSYLITNNCNDTINDIIISIKGEIEDSLSKKDTSTTIVIFGKDELYFKKSLDLSIRDTSSNEVYFSDISIGNGYHNPKKLIPNNSIYMNYIPIAPQNHIQATKELSVDLSAYPNPASNELTIQFNELSIGLYSLELISIDGIVKWKDEIAIDNIGEISKNIDVQSFSSGTYLLKVKSKDNIKYLQVVIIH